MRQLIRIVIGMMAFFMGDKARITMKFFFFIKPPLIETESYEEVITKYQGNRRTVNIHDILPMVETGDLFTFVGKVEKSYQMTIKWFTASAVSHVGICSVVDDQVKIIEATKRGFEMFNLHDRVHYFSTKYPLIIYQKLHTERSPEFHEVFEQFISKNKDKDYTPMKSKTGLLELIKSVLDLHVSSFKFDMFHNQEDLTTLFCSELVAEAYHELGLLHLDDEVPSNEFTPADFSRINEHYRWGPERDRLDNVNHGAVLGKEFFIHPELDL